MPIGSKLNNVYVEGDIAFVDFSKEFVDNHPGGSLGEYNTIYSIVNSITEIDGIEQVVFLIDGKRQNAYKGHTQFDIPISRDESMIVGDDSISSR
jgi:germination protein M